MRTPYNGRTGMATESTPQRLLHSARLRGADLVDQLRGRTDRYTPPRRLAGYVGAGDFQATGDEFLRLFIDLAGLSAGDRVLDVGCGIGRMARVLVDVLRPPGSYDGFDIVASGIRWCQSRYRHTPAPFEFRHADVRNRFYNPQGRVEAAEYRFPYPDGAFDLAIATSVFTHLLPGDAEHYLGEVARVLAPGGRLLSTWFLFGEGLPASDAEAEFLPAAETSPARVRDAEKPEAAVAYPRAWVQDRLSEHDLELKSVSDGTWSTSGGLTYQDVVVAQRPEGTGAR